MYAQVPMTAVIVDSVCDSSLLIPKSAYFASQAVLVGNEHVLRLQVAVDDAVRVEVRESRRRCRARRGGRPGGPEFCVHRRE